MFYERDDISIVVGIFGKGIKNKGIWNYVLFFLFYVLDSFYLFIIILKIFYNKNEWKKKGKFHILKLIK